MPYPAEYAAYLNLPVLIGAGLVVLLTGTVAFILGRCGRKKMNGSQEPGEAPPEETKELRKSVWLLQNESRNLATFLNLLPQFARALANSPEKRQVGPLLLQMLEQIFDPQQILIFYTSQRGDGVVLVNEKGLGANANMPRVIPLGEGRVGWVASNQVAMDESEFQAKASFLKDNLKPQGHAAFRVELAAPMVHKEELLGVITLGGLLRHPKNEKTMIRMVADLGSVALNNISMFHRMQELLNADGLTQLCTKQFFMRKLADEILEAEKGHAEFSVFIFDIDHFKSYNDNNGHLAGDECLRLTGRLLKETVRSEDVPARYGGEEFVVLLPGTPKKGAMVIAEKIRKTIQDYVYPKENNQPLGDLTVSGGIASFPYDGNTSAELISAADSALYEAKRGGRNRVLPYEPTYLSESEEDCAPVLAVKEYS